MEKKAKTNTKKSSSSSNSSNSYTFFSKPIAGLPGFTVRILILSFILLLFTTFIGTIAVSVGFGNGLLIPLILLLFIEFALSKVSKRFQLSIQEWVIFTIVGGLGIMGAGGLGYLAAVGIGMHMWPSTYAEVFSANYRPFIPNLWVVSNTKLSSAFVIGTTGTWINAIQAVQWGLWMWPLIYWFIFIVTLYLTGFFLVTILRKPWVEVERLPFPGVVATYELIKRAKAQDRPSLWTVASENLWIFIGFFLGFAVYLPSFLSFWGIIKGLPVSSAWFGQMPINLSPYISTLLPGATPTYTWAPVLLPVVVFAPMDVLVTGILCNIVFHIFLPVIMVKTGVVDTSGVGQANPETIYGVTEGPRYGFIDLYGLGGFIYGVGFFLLVFQWRRIRDTLVAAFRGTKREEGEMMSWRFVWIGFFVCTIVWIYLLTIVAVPLVMALFVWGLIVCWLMFIARLFAELAWWAPFATTESVFIGDVGTKLGYWTTPGYSNAGLSTILTWTTLTYVGPKDIGIRPSAAMENYKIGDMTQTSARSIGFSWILTLLVTVAFGLFAWMVVSYKLGIYAMDTNGYAVFSWTISDVYSRTDYALMNTIGPSGIYWWHTSPYPYMIGFFALSGILLYLRTIFPWFFINPIGVWAGMSIEYTSVVDLMFLIGFVLKFLTLRIGGAKAYEKFLVPLVIGYAIGFGFGVFITLPPQLISVFHGI
jgi:hypothetical protein